MEKINREKDTKLYVKQTRNFCVGLALFLFSVILAIPQQVQGATLSVSPSSGTFTVGSTFDVSIFLDTEKESINAIGLSMGFSPDKLQVVSPSVGKSIIEVWTASPKFNNQTGRIDLQGGIPGGINVKNGLVTTVTFRIKSVGSSIFKFLDGSRVLLNDGLGTDALKRATNGVYQLTLPPPAGPIVASTTHSSQSNWYSNPNAILNWSLDETPEGYSYILNQEPVDFPDNISEGQRNAITYKNLNDGVHYFHIKALRNGVWGGVTNFAIQIDTTPPAKFPIEVIPSSRTTKRQPVVQFNTTDYLSGIDHYELKIINLDLKNSRGGSQKEVQPLFIEAVSPYILSFLDFGKYDVIIRAYDKAGNYREITRRLSIVNTVFKFISGEGFEIRNVIFVSWSWFFTVFILAVIALIYGALRVRNWHDFIESKIVQKILPKEIKKKLEELNKYKSKYGSKILLLLLFITSLTVVSSPAFAQQQVGIVPPLITTISKNVSNEEIFYIGGKTEASQTEVILYLQNLQTGETISQNVVSDKRGDWFYRHNKFLLSGNYLLWAQSKIGDLLSPPGPQIKMTVRATAIQFGSSRISYEILYLIISLLLLIVVILLAVYIAFHFYHGRKKHIRFVKEVKEAEESVHRGFAVLKRDIQAEFALIKKAKMEKALSSEEKLKEEQLLKDLSEIERYIGKEIWDIEETEYNG